jgi:dihydroorotase/N-acyl-D-amino-acid deacylase
VAPGFIDIQAHSWEALLWEDGRVVSKVTQGVTTEILGEATTPAPSNANIEALVEIQDMKPVRAALQRSFTGVRGFGAWLDALSKHANSVNVGSYLGATTVRAYAMGQSTKSTHRCAARHDARRRARGDGRWRLRHLVSPHLSAGLVRQYS